MNGVIQSQVTCYVRSGFSAANSPHSWEAFNRIIDSGVISYFSLGNDFKLKEELNVAVLEFKWNKWNQKQGDVQDGNKIWDVDVITVKTGTYTELYYVTGLTRINNSKMIMTLYRENLIAIGLNNLHWSGTIDRKHTSEDGLFRFKQVEPFMQNQPSEKKIDFFNFFDFAKKEEQFPYYMLPLIGETAADQVGLIGTLALLDSQMLYRALTYTDQIRGNEVTTPIIQPVIDGTVLSITYPDERGTEYPNVIRFEMAGTAIYDYSDVLTYTEDIEVPTVPGEDPIIETDVLVLLECLNQLRMTGNQNLLTSSYIVPGCFVTMNDRLPGMYIAQLNSKYLRIRTLMHHLNDRLSDPAPWFPLNTKSSYYNIQWAIESVGSGDSQSYQGIDVSESVFYPGDLENQTMIEAITNPVWRFEVAAFANLSVAGTTYVRPAQLNYTNPVTSENVGVFLQGTVMGSSWAAQALSLYGSESAVSAITSGLFASARYDAEQAMYSAQQSAAATILSSQTYASNATIANAQAQSGLMSQTAGFQNSEVYNQNVGTHSALTNSSTQAVTSAAASTADAIGGVQVYNPASWVGAGISAGANIVSATSNVMHNEVMRGVANSSAGNQVGLNQTQMQSGQREAFNAQEQAYASLLGARGSYNNTIASLQGAMAMSRIANDEAQFASKAGQYLQGYTTVFTPDLGMATIANGIFKYTKYQMVLEDVQRIDFMFSKYGYTLNTWGTDIAYRETEGGIDQFWKCRKNFTYVKFSSLDLYGLGETGAPPHMGWNAAIIADIKTRLLTGVRLWQVKPDADYYYAPNPIVIGEPQPPAGIIRITAPPAVPIYVGDTVTITIETTIQNPWTDILVETLDGTEVYANTSNKGQIVSVSWNTTSLEPDYYRIIANAYSPDWNDGNTIVASYIRMIQLIAPE